MQVPRDLGGFSGLCHREEELKDRPSKSSAAANFYRQFIRDFSTITLPLTKLTSPKVSFQWDSAAQHAFTLLKERLSAAPILSQPDLTRQFIVEVDASDSGVGAVLSEQEDGKLHPCAFYSCHLSPAECNYDIGDWELLAIKLALEEWRHWLEGAAQPFIMWTDHKNLEYLRSARRLNSRQARWALFFTRFDFTITYRPGSRNMKPDALSRQFVSTEEESDPGPILPSACVIGQFYGRSSRSSRRHKNLSWTREPARPAASSFLHLFTLKFSSGLTPPISRATRGSSALYPSSEATFGAPV